MSDVFILETFEGLRVRWRIESCRGASILRLVPYLLCWVFSYVFLIYLYISLIFRSVGLLNNLSFIWFETILGVDCQALAAVNRLQAVKLLHILKGRAEEAFQIDLDPLTNQHSIIFRQDAPSGNWLA